MTHTPITFLVAVKNEESRIRYVLDVATKWADEVIVVDKGSTDSTGYICWKYYPEVKLVEAGTRTLNDWIYLAAYDWVYCGTPSEIPTRKLIDTVPGISQITSFSLTATAQMYQIRYTKISPLKMETRGTYDMQRIVVSIT
jgi:glycosyltransferase involved in cell wall biosynthesis